VNISQLKLRSEKFDDDNNNNNDDNNNNNNMGKCKAIHVHAVRAYRGWRYYSSYS